MSHIPSHAMPHAKPHDEAPHEGGDAQTEQPAADAPAQEQPERHPDLPTPVAVPAKREGSPPWPALAIGGALVAGGALIAVLAGRRSSDGKAGRKQGRRRKPGKRAAEKA